VLVVSYSGTKTFRALTYRNGKARTRKLGSYPAISVKQARAQARQLVSAQVLGAERRLPPPFQSEQFRSVTVIDRAYIRRLASVRAAQKNGDIPILRFPQLEA
jgi:Arm DNA-binding domain